MEIDERSREVLEMNDVGNLSIEETGVTQTSSKETSVIETVVRDSTNEVSTARYTLRKRDKEIYSAVEKDDQIILAE